MLPVSDVGQFATQSRNRVERIRVFFEDRVSGRQRFALRLFPWIRVGEVRRELAKVFEEKELWKELRLFSRNVELLLDRKTLFDFYKVEADSVLTVSRREPVEGDRGVINPYRVFEEVPQRIKQLLQQVEAGLGVGRKPRLASEGTSGTYFLEDQLRKVVAVYKPFDEEPYAPNNPRQLVGKLGQQGIRRGILSGECATREVAAYLLDQKEFHSVPATTYVEFYHSSFNYCSDCIDSKPIPSSKQCQLNLTKTKHGSLQEFIQYTDLVGNLGSRLFDAEEVHKVGILDLRILNCDRNEANILVQKVLKSDGGRPVKYYRFVPIDHGLSLPDNLQIYDYQLIWMNYQQSQMPFSRRSLDFIAHLNPARDAELLSDKLGFRSICLRNFRLAQTFLQQLALGGFSLFEIGTFLFRVDDDDDTLPRPSELQKLVKQAEQIYFTVKISGIKSTVQFQIGLIRARKHELSSQDSIVEEETRLPLCSNPRKTSIQKKPYERLRTVSLPHLSKQTSQIKRKRNIAELQRSNAQQPLHSKESWDEIFYHYFQDLLHRFVEEKKKAKNKPAVRSRLMSEAIDDL